MNGNNFNNIIDLNGNSNEVFMDIVNGNGKDK